MELALAVRLLLSGNLALQSGDFGRKLTETVHFADSLGERQVVSENIPRQLADKILVDGVQREPRQAAGEVFQCLPAVGVEAGANFDLAIRWFPIKTDVSLVSVAMLQQEEDMVGNHRFHEPEQFSVQLSRSQGDFKNLEFVHRLAKGDVQGIRRKLVGPGDSLNLLNNAALERRGERQLLVQHLFGNALAEFGCCREREHSGELAYDEEADELKVIQPLNWGE